LIQNRAKHSQQHGKLTILAILLLTFGVSSTWAGTTANEFLRGADVSFLPAVETAGGVFRDDGQTGDALDILRAHGLNTIRLRLWHTPSDRHDDLATTLALAARAKTAGLNLLLDFHYSDTWADPSHQSPPVVWQGLPLAALADSVRTYTHNTLVAFAAQGTAPAFVQLGNEITSGLLWPIGHVGGTDDTPTQWTQLAILLRAASDGVASALPDALKPDIIIHTDRGGDNAGARWLFDGLLAQGFDFDLIGVSYYPWWHGSLADLETNLHDLARRYGKEIVVVETGYPWSVKWSAKWSDNTNNIIGSGTPLLPGFAATPAGQRDFLAALFKIVHSVPQGRGRGVFWWAPTWIAAPRLGSAWENVALFNEKGESLPALEVFRAGP